MAGNGRVDVAIIGAGMSGICMGVKLRAAGIDSFTIFEQADEVGGTWRDNTYPGLHCDVPSPYYSYSFAPNPDWSRLQSPGPEIQAYLRRVADDHRLREHIRFGTEVTAATYRDGRWWLTTERGQESFDVVVAATGVLRIPRYPDISGRDTFAGAVLHSARWDDSVSLADKRIGLIGTGSTGVQITSALGGTVGRLDVFQRTPQWVYPWPNLRYRTRVREFLHRWPMLRGLGYRFWGLVFRRALARGVVGPGWQRRQIVALCRLNLRLSVRDRELRSRLTPTYQPGCKRLILAGHYYQSLQKPGVNLISETIERIESRGVVTADGRLHELDVLVFATGFDARAYVRPMRITGPDGGTLDQTWADGAYAYRSVAVPGFPNFFLLMGPHAPVGSNSLIPIAENQADYLLWWIQQIRGGAITSAAPTEAATKLYNEDMKAAMSDTVWVTGCQSWYLGKDGLPELFPWVPERYTELMSRPATADFEVS